MKTIGVRELRQNASKYLEAVEAGETFEVTSHGRGVAMLVPKAKLTGLARLIALGLVTPAKRPFKDLPPPLPCVPGEPTLSEILQEMRDGERY